MSDSEVNEPTASRLRGELHAHWDERNESGKRMAIALCEKRVLSGEEVWRLAEWFWEGEERGVFSDEDGYEFLTGFNVYRVLKNTGRNDADWREAADYWERHVGSSRLEPGFMYAFAKQCGVICKDMMREE